MAQEPREVNPVTFFDPLKGRPTDKDFAVRAVPSDEPDPNEVVEVEAPKEPATSVIESALSLEQTPSVTEEKSASAAKVPASPTTESSSQTSSPEVKETSTGSETQLVTPPQVKTPTSGSLA